MQRIPNYILDHFICKLPGSQITLDNMAEAFTMFSLMILSTVIGHCVASTLSSEQHVDENTILDIAEKSNKTFLKLIGLAIQNLRCDLDRCSQWSQWTIDALAPGQFGVKTRSRDCWYASCNKTGQKVVENDSEIFERNCPVSYNITHEKFCVAFIQNKHNYSSAKQLCEKDGGQIINLDTKERYETAKLYTGIIHIQGERRVTGGPFYDDVGGLPLERPFFKWASGQPNDGTSVSNTLMLTSAGYYDAPVGYMCSVLCEVVY